MKICVFGGSFNPPHKGHEHMVDVVLAQKLADKVIIVPTGNGYEKLGLIDSCHRLDMLQIVFGNKPNVEVSDVECRDRKYYTYMLLKQFKEEYPGDQISFLMGSDNYKQLHTWDDFDALISEFAFVVAVRDDDDEQDLKSLYPKAKVKFLHDIDKISSTELRLDVYGDQKLIAYLDSAIVKYILNNRLYR